MKRLRLNVTRRKNRSRVDLSVEKVVPAAASAEIGVARMEEVPRLNRWEEKEASRRRGW